MNVRLGATAIAVFLAAALTACGGQAGRVTGEDPPADPDASTRVPTIASEVTSEPGTAIAAAAGTAGKTFSSQGLQTDADNPPASSFPPPPDRDPFQLASQLIDPALKDLPNVVNPFPVSYPVGRRDTFWMLDLEDLEIYQRPFELMLVTPHAYWYVEEDQGVNQNDLELSAAVFEGSIYPTLTGVFGQEWTPGVDNDPHLTILNGALRGAAGYYSSGDEYPEAVSPYSNQREMIYVNLDAYPVDSPQYLQVLAHELQHAIHWHADPSEETWINEGLSEFAATVAGFPSRSIPRFLDSRPTSVVHWPLAGSGVQSSYGGASLFIHYLIEQYGDPANIKPLLEQPADGIAGIEAYLAGLGHQLGFKDVFGNWMAANVLDLDSGRYSHPGLEVQAQPHRRVDGESSLRSSIPQYAPEYIKVTQIDGPSVVTFDGPSESRLLPVNVGAQGCWWSNSGDSINTTLTRDLDLRSAATSDFQTALEYQVWYDLEEDWDYVYLEVSEDQGESWAIIETPDASPANPVGIGYGPGYTGLSGGWIDQSIDLSAYSGKEVQLRFQYVTDDAINGSGLCLRRISLLLDRPGAGVEAIPSQDGWEPEGFIATDNRVRQEYIVQVIWNGDGGRVETLELQTGAAQDWHGELLIKDDGSIDGFTIAVAALAPKTRLPVRYSLSVTPAP